MFWKVIQVNYCPTLILTVSIDFTTSHVQSMLSTWPLSDRLSFYSLLNLIVFILDTGYPLLYILFIHIHSSIICPLG